jgi:peptide/nickel transport system substrate-binding protein
MGNVFAAWAALLALALSALWGPPGAPPKLLVIAVDAPFQERWNPFANPSAADQAALGQIFATVMQADAQHALVPYAGVITAEQQPEGPVRYTVALNRGMRFTNGDPVTIDDYIHGLYIRADPGYTGPDALLPVPIQGLAAYYYDDPDYPARLAELDAAAEQFLPERISLEDFAAYARATNLDGWWDGGKDWGQYARAQGFGHRLEDPGVDLFALVTEIEWALYREYYDTYRWARDTLLEGYIQGNLADGVDVPGISGLEKIDDYTCAVWFQQAYLAGDLALNTYLTPKNYYGAFPKGDLSGVVSVPIPLGSGPYQWQGFDGGTVTCAANRDFFLGSPALGTVRWTYLPPEALLPALASGDVDIAALPGSRETVADLEALAHLRLDYVEQEGYGSLGMNTLRVPLNLRRGLWCLLNRRPSVERYYGPEAARVLQRPMSATLAEYPRGAGEYYPYSPGQALAYFNRAGYTQTDGKLLDTKGTQLALAVYISSDGTGEHPAYPMLEQAAEDLAALGGELQIYDVSFTALQTAIEEGTADAWVMAWRAAPSCDKTEQFHSTGSQNWYRFKDARMDSLLERIAQTAELEPRRALVAELLDYAMDQAVEYPLYQRRNILAINTERLNSDTIPYATYANALWRADLANFEVDPHALRDD